MFFIYLLGAGMAVCLLQMKVLARYRHCTNRRGLMGYEVAHNLLDLSGASHIAVEKEGEGRRGLNGGKYLLLPKAVYEGKSLLAVAEAAHQSALAARVNPFPRETLLRVWNGFRALFPLALLVLAVSLARPEGVGAKAFCWFLFTPLLAGAVLDMPSQWQAGKDAFTLLKQTGHFEVDELAKLRDLLRALRWSPVTGIFQFPKIFFAGRSR